MKEYYENSNIKLTLAFYNELGTLEQPDEMTYQIISLGRGILESGTVIPSGSTYIFNVKPEWNDLDGLPKEDRKVVFKWNFDNQESQGVHVYEYRLIKP